MKYCLTILFLLIFYYAYSCSCLTENEIKSELEQTDLVIDGKLIKSDTLYDSLFSKSYYYTVKNLFEIVEVFKGKKIKDTVSIISGIGHDDCGFVFKENARYIIYAIKVDKSFIDGKSKGWFYYTSICRRTKEYNALEIDKIKLHLKK